MQLSAADQYHNMQHAAAHAAHTDSINSAVKPTDIQAESTYSQDSVSISSRLFIYSQIAQEFNVSAISFEQVQALKSELFKNGLIGIKGSDALTLATQGQPNHSSFDLAQVTRDFFQHTSNAYLRPTLQPMQALFANLAVLHQPA